MIDAPFEVDPTLTLLNAFTQHLACLTQPSGFCLSWKQATMQGMTQSVESLLEELAAEPSSVFVAVDGNRVPKNLCVLGVFAEAVWQGACCF